MPNFCRTMKPGLATSLLAAVLLLLPPAANAEHPDWHHGLSLVGELKYKPNFPHYDYVNPNAPKGGDVRLSNTGTYDTFNPILDRGEVAVGLALVFDTLMKSADDEISTAYGLLAEGVSYPADISSATFRLRQEAKWADGKPVTPEDVIFSFDKTKELNPLYSNYYKHVKSAEKTGERDVTFHFDEKNNHELPHIPGQFLILPKHWWEGQGPDGKPRDINKTTLEPVMGSGPYKIASFSAGATIRYELRDDYWGKSLNVNVGHNNFGSISYTFFGDRDVEFILEMNCSLEFRFHRHAGPADRAFRVAHEHAEAGVTQEGVFRFFRVSEERGEVRDASGVRFAEFHAAANDEGGGAHAVRGSLVFSPDA